MKRLSVNMNDETAAALFNITGSYGISYTEAIRRAVALYKLHTDAAGYGHRILLDDGEKTTEVRLLGEVSPPSPGTAAPAPSPP